MKKMLVTFKETEIAKKTLCAFFVCFGYKVKKISDNSFEVVSENVHLGLMDIFDRGHISEEMIREYALEIHFKD
jgi:hypothetical protein